MNRVLIIEDEEGLRENLQELFEAEGFVVDTAPDGKIGVATALSRPPDVVLCDIAMPVMDGYEVLEALRDHPSTTSVAFLFLTARASRAEVRLGMSLGADDYITKPFEPDEILDAVRGRLARRRPASVAPTPGSAPAPGTPAAPSPEALPDPAALLVRSAALARAWERARRAASSDLSILLLGETGVGKDVFAHAIHRASPRRERPFIPLHCAALPASLLESELFGYEKGSFTGATASRAGLLESADGGSVFLDEVGEVPLETQVKLLRVLEDRSLTRVGGRAARSVDLRFVAATNRRLEEAVRDGAFRADLYFRLAAVVVEIPPLRERREEILPLAERFARIAADRRGTAGPPGFSDEARAALVGHDWPGNVRELRNAVEQAIALCDEPVLPAEAFPFAPLLPGSDGGRLRDELRAVERQRIVDALDRYGGNQTRAARALGMARRTFLNRLDEFDLPRPRR